MWSGPRNISTAMMRAWENRSDTVVVDEPFYAHYLKSTGIQHPMAAEVIADGDTDWKNVVQTLVQQPEDGIFYQKHISTHWMDYFSSDWLEQLKHVFLIREPEPVVASYANKRDRLTMHDLGYSQQTRLFELIHKRSGKRPPVIDSRRFLDNPEEQLKRLCKLLNINFQAAMLSWPAGSRRSDGVWQSHWYDAVRKSTGFGSNNNKPASLSEDEAAIAQQCRPHYDALFEYAL